MHNSVPALNIYPNMCCSPNINHVHGVTFRTKTLGQITWNSKGPKQEKNPPTPFMIYLMNAWLLGLSYVYYSDALHNLSQWNFFYMFLAQFFENFPPDPYYEPLSWFMIIKWVISKNLITTDFVQKLNHHIQEKMKADDLQIVSLKQIIILKISVESFQPEPRL